MEMAGTHGANPNTPTLEHRTSLRYSPTRDIINSRGRGYTPTYYTGDMPQEVIYSMSKKVNTISGKVNALDYVSENGYPEVGVFVDQKSLQKFYKQLDTEVLEDWATLEGLTYNPCPDSAPIHRMRVAMAILYKHFPKAPSANKKKSKYSEYTTESLIQMALDNDVLVEPTPNESIMRMRVIMALRVHGILEAK